MLPPHAPGVLVEIASLPRGATPTHPSIGRSGSSIPPGVTVASSSRAIPFALSIVHCRRFASRSVRALIAVGVVAYGDSRLPDQADTRLVSILLNVTTSV